MFKNLNKSIFINNFLKLSVLLTVIIFNTSCSVLQWRSTDTEIKTDFGKKEIPHNITYYTVDSLDLKVRVLENL